MTKKKFFTISSVVVVVATITSALYVMTDHRIEKWLGTKGIAALEEKLNTRVSVDSVDLRFFDGKISFRGFEMEDRNKVTMLKVDTLSVSADIFGLLSHKLFLDEVKMHGVTAVLYKERKDTAANYQFAIDAFKPEKRKKSKGKGKTEITLNLEKADFSRMNLSWDVKSERVKGGDTIDVNHLCLTDMHLALRGKMHSKKTLDVVASALKVHEKKSGIDVTLKSGQYRTIGSRSVTMLLSDFYAKYRDKHIGFDKLSLWQSCGSLQLKKEFSVRIDSLRYSCNNGKPRKNFHRPNRGAFDAGHLDVAANLELEMHHISKDSIIGVVHHMDGVDKGSGLIISNLSTFFDIHGKRADITMLKVSMPRTQVTINKVTIGLPQKADGASKSVVIQPCRVNAQVCLQDLAKPFSPSLSNFTTRMLLSVDAGGTMDCLQLHNIYIRTADNRLKLTAEGELRDITKKHLLSLHFRDIHLNARNGVKEQIVKHFEKKVNLKMERQMKAVGDVSFVGSLDIPYKHERIAGTLFTRFGNVSIAFDIDNNSRFLTGTMRGKNIEIGKLMDVDKLGPVTANAEYSFNVSSKNRQAKGRNTGKLPIGWLNAQIEDVSYKKIHFRDIRTEMVSDGTTANGVVSTSLKLFDVTAEFEYKQTVSEQSWKVKPHLAKHRLSLKEMLEKKEQTQEKTRKKNEREAKRNDVKSKAKETKSIFSRIKSQLSALKKKKDDTSGESDDND